MQRKRLAVLLVCCMCALLLYVPVLAESAPTFTDAAVLNKNMNETGLTATLDANGVLTVSGTGEFPAYASTYQKQYPWFNAYWTN
ncbi:MAG: hypothetical protein IJE10_04845, partial [Clostridia bacterium]|nr:hypothetical protein [Clostridia bacterium]